MSLFLSLRETPRNRADIATDVIRSVLVYIWALLGLEGLSLSIVECLIFGSTLSATDPVTIVSGSVPVQQTEAHQKSEVFRLLILSCLPP